MMTSVWYLRDLVQEVLVDAGRALEHLHLVDEVADRAGGEHVGDRVLVAALVIGGQARGELLLGAGEVLPGEVQRLLVETQRRERVEVLLVDAVVDLDRVLGLARELRELRLGGRCLGLLLGDRRGAGRGRRQRRSQHPDDYAGGDARSGCAGASARLASGGGHCAGGYQTSRRDDTGRPFAFTFPSQIGRTERSHGGLADDPDGRRERAGDGPAPPHIARGSQRPGAPARVGQRRGRHGGRSERRGAAADAGAGDRGVKRGRPRDHGRHDHPLDGVRTTRPGQGRRTDPGGEGGEADRAAGDDSR